jgi:hypothetical protein
MVSPLVALASALRSVPLPLSAVLVTAMVVARADVVASTTDKTDSAAIIDGKVVFI